MPQRYDYFLNKYKVYSFYLQNLHKHSQKLRPFHTKYKDKSYLCNVYRKMS